YAGNPLVRVCGGAGGQPPALPGSRRSATPDRMFGRGPWAQAQYVSNASAVRVAQTASLLCRRMRSCRTAPWPECLISANTQPIANRRYSRLTICATLNRYRPGGTSENSPAFQRWGPMGVRGPSPARDERASRELLAWFSFVPDGTQGYWLSNPPMNRWAIFYRPDGLGPSPDSLLLLGCCPNERC